MTVQLIPALDRIVGRRQSLRTPGSRPISEIDFEGIEPVPHCTPARAPFLGFNPDPRLDRIRRDLLWLKVMLSMILAGVTILLLLVLTHDWTR